jgi:hypothetical protein
VQGTGGTSLHLSFGFQRRTGMTYLGWLTTLLRKAPLFREDLPRDVGAEDLERHAKLLTECFVQLVRDHPLEEYLAQHVESLAPPAPLRLDSRR